MEHRVAHGTQSQGGTGPTICLQPCPQSRAAARKVVQTINEEIVKVVNNTAADVNYSKNGFSQTSPKQSKFSSAPKDSHNSNVSNCTVLFNPVQATWQAHHMQQDILPEGTKEQFLSVGNALGYEGQVFSDFKAFAIHLPSYCCSTWIQ